MDRLGGRRQAGKQAVRQIDHRQIDRRQIDHRQIADRMADSARATIIYFGYGEREKGL